MIKVIQTRTGAPEGNCEAACYASIFELSIDGVPDPRWPSDVPWQEAQDGPQQTEAGRAVRQSRYEVFDAWLAARGLTMLAIAVTPGCYIPKGYAIGGVTNVRGVPHAVVCLDGRIVWDPNPAQDSYDCPLEILMFFVVMDPSRLVMRYPV